MSPARFGLVALFASAYLATPDVSDDDDDVPSPPDGDADADSDADSDADTTCEDVQRGVFAEGDAVILPGLVATTEVDWHGTGFYVQDPGGGQYHCLFVYLDTSTAEVARGDEVTVVGTVKEYYGFTEVTLAEGGSVTVTGTAAVTDDTLVTAPSDWEPYEGCLVELRNVAVTDVADYGEHTTTWGINVDDQFVTYTGSVPATYSSIVGAINYAFDEYKIEPRDMADFVP